VNRFSEFADASGSDIMDGKKVQMEDIIGKEIVVIGYRIRDTKFADAKTPRCVTIQFTYPNETEHHIVFSGSNVLMRQLDKYRDKIPFLTTIKKVGKYFTFS
jgi:hypothetical protein